MNPISFVNPNPPPKKTPQDHCFSNPLYEHDSVFFTIKRFSWVLTEFNTIRGQVCCWPFCNYELINLKSLRTFGSEASDFLARSMALLTVL